MKKRLKETERKCLICGSVKNLKEIKDKDGILIAYMCKSCFQA
jgi:hypothetical protein